MINKNWKKEIARDCIALGSIPFYFIVIIRAIIGKYAIFVYQLLIALVVLIILSFIVKKFLRNFLLKERKQVSGFLGKIYFTHHKELDMYIARSFVLFAFTSLFYKHNLYTIFAFLLWVFVVMSSHYLKVKKNVIIKGIVLGIVSSLVAYYLALFVG